VVRMARLATEELLVTLGAISAEDLLDPADGADADLPPVVDSTGRSVLAPVLVHRASS
jgi:hypothetical protein